MAQDHEEEVRIRWGETVDELHAALDRAGPRPGTWCTSEGSSRDPSGGSLGGQCWGVGGLLHVPLSGGTNAVTIPGFAINPFGLNVPLSGGTNAVTIPGFAINPFGLNVPLSGGTSPVTIPGFTIPGSPLNLTANGGLGPINIPINITSAPGFGNSTTTPSSGFFNSGDGSASGFGNVGPGISGLWNQVPNALQGGVSGIYNVGQLASGVANLGNTVSGFNNTSTVGHLTAAFNSGVNNIGQMLLGFFSPGAGP